MIDASDDTPARRQAALNDIRQAIASGEVQIVDSAIAELRSTGGPSDLGAALLTRFDLTGDPQSLREAVAVLQAAAGLAPGQPRPLTNLGLAMIRLFELTDDLPTLVMAISLLRQAVDRQAATGPSKASYLANLGLALVRLAERTGEPAPLAEAVERHTAAAGLATEQPATRAAMLANLGTALAIWHRLDGAPERLTAAVDAYHEAVRLVPPEHAYARGCMAGLGDTLAAAASAHGDVALSVAALGTLRSAVYQMPERDPDGPLFLDQLAAALRRSYALTGDSQALAESIDCRRRALDRAPPGHPDRLHYQANLALSLRNRFEAVGDVNDLWAADELIREVLDIVPTDHPERPKWQADLAHVRHRLGIHQLDEGHLREAAELLRAAVAAVSAQSRDAVMHRINLGAVLVTALELRWDPAGYDEVVRVLGEGLHKARPGAPERAELLLNLGQAHAARLQADGTAEAYDAATDAFGEVVGTVTAPARIRALAGRHQASLHARRGASTAAVAAYRTVLDLLDLIAWRGLARDDQERALVEFRGLGSEAAASAIEVGDPDAALSLLEQGRGVLLAQVLEQRGDQDSLELAQPALARQLRQVHDAMEAGARHRATDPDVTHGEAAAAVFGERGADEAEGGGELLERQRLAIRRDDLLGEIRQCDGFADFLRAPDVAGLRAAAADGAVVMLNLAESRCDALVTTRSGTEIVPLPDLSIRDAAARTASFLDAVNANTWGTNDVVRETLAWLWDVAVWPVFDQLGESAAVNALTRVWWVPTGALSLLPVHAAGHHGPGNGDARSALHRVVSSYTPTLRVLARTNALTNPSPLDRADTTLVIGADSGPTPLATVVAETRVVSTHRAGSVRTLLGAECTRSAVLAELPAASWVHIAGHAITDSRHPSESHLKLHDGHLRAREISTLPPSSRELAYLSACETAVGGTRLPDEVIHIASAFQLAGFRNTIGTLWRVPDRAAQDTAAAVYTRLRHHPPARAVNLAARRHRDTYRANPYEWAAFVHSGPG